MTNRYRFVEDVQVAKDMGLIPAKSRKKKVHIHTLDGKPLIGTSSVSDILAKPLTWWASGLAVVQFGVTDPKLLTKIKNKKITDEEMPLVESLMESLKGRLAEIGAMNIDEYFTLIDKAYRAHDESLDKSADAGTDLHAELERFVKDEMKGANMPIETYHERIYPYIKWSREQVDHYLWSEVHTYSEKNWTGGISDAGAVLKNGKTVIIDFKSSKEAYLSQFWQCGGYEIGFNESGGFDAEGNQVLPAGFVADEYIVVPFGMEVIEPQFYVNPIKAQECFLHELALYKELPRD